MDIFSYILYKKLSSIQTYSIDSVLWPVKQPGLNISGCFAGDDLYTLP